MKERGTAISLRVALSYLALFAFTVFALYPITRIITIALRPGDQLLSTSLAFIPAGATLANFRILLTSPPFLRWLVNSTAIALAVTLTGVALASTAGYAPLSLSLFRPKQHVKWIARHADVSGNDVTSPSLSHPDQAELN